jgi:hypothetical protein
LNGQSKLYFTLPRIFATQGIAVGGTDTLLLKIVVQDDQGREWKKKGTLAQLMHLSGFQLESPMKTSPSASLFLTPFSNEKLSIQSSSVLASKIRLIYYKPCAERFRDSLLDLSYFSDYQCPWCPQWHFKTLHFLKHHLLHVHFMYDFHILEKVSALALLLIFIICWPSPFIYLFIYLIFCLEQFLLYDR